jgi:sensor domain CHASE-containing protein
MTLTRRTLLKTGLTLGGLICIIFLISRWVLLNSFVDLENSFARSNLQRAINAWDEEIDNLYYLVTDYAHWNDSYAFMQKYNPDFIQSNFTNNMFMTNRLNLAIILDNSGKVVFAKGFNLGQERER